MAKAASENDQILSVQRIPVTDLFVNTRRLQSVSRVIKLTAIVTLVLALLFTYQYWHCIWNYCVECCGNRNMVPKSVTDSGPGGGGTPGMVALFSLAIFEYAVAVALDAVTPSKG
jgi:hypothetical protein